MKVGKYLLVGVVVLILLFSTSGSFAFFKTYSVENQSKGAVLEVTTDKTIYKTGKNVTIYFTNIGDETLSAGGPIVTIYNDEDEIVYQQGCYCWWEIEPGEYEEWPPWDQTDQQGIQVPIGIYTIEGFLSGHIENYTDTTEIYIVDYEPPGPPTGPTDGVVGVEYEFCFYLPMNPDGDPYFIKWDFGDGTITEWAGPFAPGQNVCEVHAWDEVGLYDIRVGIKDIYGTEYWSEPLTLNIYENSPPTKPMITGPSKKQPGVPITYTIVATDPDGDDIKYLIDWDDGNMEETGYYQSGVEVGVTHSWAMQGAFVVRAKAIDIYGAEGPWGSEPIFRSKYNNIFSIILQFLENHPLIHKMINIL